MRSAKSEISCNAEKNPVDASILSIHQGHRCQRLDDDMRLTIKGYAHRIGVDVTEDCSNKASSVPLETCDCYPNARLPKARATNEVHFGVNSASERWAPTGWYVLFNSDDAPYTLWKYGL